MNDTSANTESGPLICPATKDSAIRLLIGAAGCLGWGVFCAVDINRGEYKHTPFSMENINEWSSWAVNFYSQFIFIPAGLILVYLAIRSAKKVFVADAEGLGYQGKEKTPWSEVTSLDSKDLAKKQILYVRCGPDKKITLDGYKLHEFKALVAFVEDHTPAGADPGSDEPAE